MWKVLQGKFLSYKKEEKRSTILHVQVGFGTDKVSLCFWVSTSISSNRRTTGSWLPKPKENGRVH